MDDIDRTIAHALIGVAAEMQVEVLDTGDPTRVYESDMRSSMRRHLNRRLSHGMTARAEAGIGKEHFLRGGSTDIAVFREDECLAVIELKWWSDPSNQVDEALWDAVKVATYVRERVARAGYLISAGADQTWTGTNPLLRFWVGGEWPLAEIQALKPYYTRIFEGEAGPVVPLTSLRAEPVRAVPIHTVAGDWSLRCCRVTAS